MLEQAAPRNRLLAISSGGGHWVQLLRMQDAFAGCDVTYSSVHRMYASDVAGERFVAIPDATRWDRVRLLRMICAVCWLIFRVRPHVIISTGAAPARTIWVDSMANVEQMSLSGQKARPYADLWLTQWEHLANEDGPEYAGTVL